MKSRLQKIRLGVFLVISMAVLVLIIGFFTAREFFENEDVYFISYEDTSVRGLEVGSPVRYMGIKVGSIKDIMIDPQDVNNIIVELAIKTGTPMKQDTQAEITSTGITGLKSIEIRGGSNEAESLKPGSYIKAGSSLREEITGKAEVIAEKLEIVLNNISQFSHPDNLHKFTEMADQITQLAIQAQGTINRVDTVINQNQEDVREVIKSAKEISTQLNRSSKLLLATIETINRKVKGDTLNQILADISEVSGKLKEADVKSLIDNISKVAFQTQQLLSRIGSDLDRSSEDFSESLKLLELTLKNLNEASIKINNDPSILLRGVKAKTPDENLNR